MARRPVLDLDAEKTVQFDEKGQEFSGYYLGFKTVKNELSKDGTSLLHIFQTEEGKVGIWGTKKLNDKLAGILAETRQTRQAYMTFVTYGGKVKLGAGKTQHLFDVDFDDAITLDLGAVAADTSSAAKVTSKAAALTADEADDIADDYDAMTEEVDEEPAAPAVRQPLKAGKPQAFTKEHTSKVANMLSKK